MYSIDLWNQHFNIIILFVVMNSSNKKYTHRSLLQCISNFSGSSSRWGSLFNSTKISRMVQSAKILIKILNILFAFKGAFQPVYTFSTIRRFYFFNSVLQLLIRKFLRKHSFLYNKIYDLFIRINTYILLYS